jgi:hypothetical protein
LQRAKFKGAGIGAAMFAVGWKISNLLAASRLQFRALMRHVWNASPPVLCWQLAIQTFVIDTL